MHVLSFSCRRFIEYPPESKMANIYEIQNNMIATAGALLLMREDKEENLKNKEHFKQSDQNWIKTNPSKHLINEFHAIFPKEKRQ